MKVLTTIKLRCSQDLAQGANDPIASGLPWMAIRGRPFLSEQAHDNRIRYYKGAISEAPAKRIAPPWLKRMNTSEGLAQCASLIAPYVD
jgi:hypothetical protein